jgi:phi13 family phage major tail protein
MANKVRFGLRNTKYALYNSQTGTYGSPKEFKGAVSLSLSREGGDSSDFYADDGVYHTFAGTNGGYSMELNMARIFDEVRADLLGELVDETTGVQYEVTTAEPAQFALITEMQGDQNPMGFVFYNCKASRPEMSANTKNDSPDVDTDTLNVRVAAQEFTIDGIKQGVVQGHIEKTADNVALYNAFFSAVTIPGGGESGLSA